MAAVGRKVPRKEGVAKVTGAARYVDDLSFPGMLHGATVRSTISRGEILSIRHDFDRDGFTVVDFRDIPGRNVVALIEDDQPKRDRGRSWVMGLSASARDGEPRWTRGQLDRVFVLGPRHRLNRQLDVISF